MAGGLGSYVFGAEEKKELMDVIEAGASVIARSGWHVYNNMEQILDKKTWTNAHPFRQDARTYEKHMLPVTDDILERAVNISVGVVDKGLGTGININSTVEEINQVAKNIREIILSLQFTRRNVQWTKSELPSWVAVPSVIFT